MRTWVEISRGKLAENYSKICAFAGPGVAVCGVVKANAYGHGAVEVSRVLAETGAEWLAVSNVAEGMELRAAGIAARILVMGGVLPEERACLLDAALTPVIHSLEELRAFDSMAKPIDVHFKVDTGMHRLGSLACAEQIEKAVGSLRRIRVEGLMSHFASPEDPRRVQEQLQLFDRILQQIRPEIAHIASSFALNESLKQTRYNMVRPGIALYGHAPVCGVTPVLRWKARILEVKDLPAGAAIGYGGRYRASRAMRTAVIAAGYADGLPRALTNRGSVEVGGMPAPIVGAVSMDLTTIDISAAPHAKPGDEAEIFPERIAEDSGTITYEILTGIGSRVVRIYR